MARWIWRCLALAAVFGLNVTSARAHITCDRAPFTESADIAALHRALSDAVASFPGLRRTLDSGLNICVSDALLSELGYYQPEGRRLVLASGMEPGLTLAVAVHELRHVEQFDVGSCPSLSLSMRDYANAVFAMEADASVTSLIVAAYLRDSGAPAMWTALADWPMQADLAARFDDVLSATSDVGQAATAAFEAWYDSDQRRDRYYVSVCSDYLDQLERSHSFPSYDSLTGDYFGALCRLPDGTAYDCRPPSAP